MSTKNKEHADSIGLFIIISMCKTILLLILFLCFSSLQAQTLTEKLILTDSEDSTFLKAESIVFNKNGEYCFNIQKGDNDYFFRSMDTLGPFSFIGNISSSGGIMPTNSVEGESDSTHYIKNETGITVYGPYRGKVNDDFIARPSREDIAFTVKYRDSVFYYIDNSIVSVISDSSYNEYRTESWCRFSKNRNKIFYSIRNGKYFLFVNSDLLDSSEQVFKVMDINNKGEYIYSKSTNPGSELHVNNISLNVNVDIDRGEIKNNGGYYFYGNDLKSRVLFVNNKIFTDTLTVSDIRLVNKINFAFSNTIYDHKKDEDKVIKVIVNGSNIFDGFKKIDYMTIDSNGNYAFYILKDYFLYKVVNGLKSAPISKYGVRAVPIYITPSGESIHYFQTDDSTYIYKDNEQIFPAFGNNVHFNVYRDDDLIRRPYTRGRGKDENRLVVIEIDSASYFILNGKISNPMKLIAEKSYKKNKETGEFAAVQNDDEGFFMIQAIGSKKFMININNLIYKEIEDIDQIIEDSCFLDGNKLTFYVIKDRSFYQYILTE